MNWLQNTIAIIISFLIARMMIDADIHKHYVRLLLKKSGANLSSFLWGILLTSYFFSIFFSNTVVVLSMLPIIKIILESIADKELKQKISTPIVLALIYGANIGGMASLTGAPLNIVYVGFIELNQIPGRENITFFSWLVLGIPATMIMILISRLVLKLSERKLFLTAPLRLKDNTPVKRNIKKYTGFFVFNMLALVSLTATQFWLKPLPVLGAFNPIDISMMFYLGAFLFFGFILPRGKGSLITYPKNMVAMLLFLVLIIPIGIIEICKDFIFRFRLKGIKTVRRADTFLLDLFNRVWFFSFKEKQRSLKSLNPNAYVSLNRLVYDLPFFGLVFMGVVLLMVFLLVKIGDNPATPNLDGYILQFFQSLSSQLALGSDQVFVFLLAVIMIAIFFTEIINNTTVVLIMFPLVLNLVKNLAFNPIFALLALTIAASGAFMTPIATPVNAISFASFKRVSLKKMLGFGFLMNILGGLWITIVFYFLGHYI
jgi:solute carrier family 13 (sodium-dependent dicarboxylate transporter), member 2/3/5